MFVFQTKDDKELKVFFRYEREEVPANPHKETSKPHTRPVGTTCMIVDRNNIVVGLGSVRCHYKDRFRYAKGRKYALRNALKDANLNRDSRKNAWSAFLRGM